MAQGRYFRGFIVSAQAHDIRQFHRPDFPLQEIAETAHALAAGAGFRPDQVIFLPTGDGGRQR